MPAPKLTKLFTRKKIEARVAELAAQIKRDYEGKPILCLTVLKGGFFFAADLIRAISELDVQLEFVTLTSYAGTRSTGRVEFRGQLPRVAGYDVLVIEDLVDTGLTLASLHEQLKAQGPSSLRYAIAVDKKARREVEFTADYIAFDLEKDLFLVGYGMDHEGRYRTLPDICKLE
jgi:hypoxanthine phosphoribosyltransferase